MAAHAELLRHDEIKPYATALLGHSEGGLLAARRRGGNGQARALRAGARRARPAGR